MPQLTRTSVLGALLLATLGLATVAHAAYQRRWFSIDGGGAIPSVGPLGYRLGGTVGQPDAAPMTGGSYRIRGGFWSNANQVGFVDVPADPVRLPAAFHVFAPSPNPARSNAAITFDLATARDVVVQVCDLQGRMVRELDRSRREAGRHRLTWDARDRLGGRVEPGLYFVRVDAGSDHGVAKLILLPEGASR